MNKYSIGKDLGLQLALFLWKEILPSVKDTPRRHSSAGEQRHPEEWHWLLTLALMLIINVWAEDHFSHSWFNFHVLKIMVVSNLGLPPNLGFLPPNVFFFFFAVLLTSLISLSKYL